MVDIYEVPAREPRLTSFLQAQHTAQIARRGELVDARDRPALIALTDGETVGVLIYDIDGTNCEIVNMRASDQWGGVGTALIERIAQVARAQGCSRLWLVTTNDNLDSMQFYQRRGFRLSAVRCGAVDEARRTLKPDIPDVGYYKIQLRDEIEFERDLEPA
ncbi:GNAT family N-acetyltransferase [Prescottella agglutinans]|uniref:GNAT family N-acetyltransferase n=1 Tax=Prescottella agglutinans TaxID=1644129 RepID=A0A438B983_9NOCA|nr:GNAT family N-acetyltransferase [Prescottella agglutinans]RVW07538.1 GNAT family N-acetyltransferase [Prescottella agglutinans]